MSKIAYCAGALCVVAAGVLFVCAGFAWSAASTPSAVIFAATSASAENACSVVFMNPSGGESNKVVLEYWNGAKWIVVCDIADAPSLYTFDISHDYWGEQLAYDELQYFRARVGTHAASVFAISVTSVGEVEFSADVDAAAFGASGGRDNQSDFGALLTWGASTLCVGVVMGGMGAVADLRARKARK